MAYKRRFSFATVLAANFGCNQFRIMPDIVYKPFLRVSEVSVLFDWNLNRRPFLDQVVDLDLLPDSEHANLFLCLILLRDQ